MSKQIILTGATGCLGQAMVPVLRNAGHEVIAIVRPGSAGNEQLAGLQTIELELDGRFSPASLPARCDWIIHLAQSRHYRDFPGSADEVFAINTAATMGFVQYAVGASVSNFIYASTGTVYAPAETPLDENAATVPGSFYTASKLAAEQLLSPYSDLMTVFIPRLFYLYGPGQQSMLATNLAQRIRDGDPITLHGEEGISLAPTFSGDVARILSVALKEDWSGICNVAGSEVVSLRELALAIGVTIGEEPRFEDNPATRPINLLPALDLLASRYKMANLTRLATGLEKTFHQNS